MFSTNLATRFSLTLAAAAGLVLAQDAPLPAQPVPQQNEGGWHRMQPSAGTQTAPVADTAAAEQQAAPAPAPLPAIPSQLTVKAGTYITIRLNDFLSSDRNQ